jgi:sugar phosphate permease
MSTRWLATNQAFCAIGIIFGYFIGALAVDLSPENNIIGFDWRKAFACQGFALCFIAFGFLCFDNSRLDIFGDRIEEVPHNFELRNIGAHSQQSKLTRKEVAHEKFGDSLPLQDFRELLGNKIFFYVMMALCSIYFSSCALQFWCTTYTIVVINVLPSTGHLLFGMTAITSPLMGAYVGGTITDAYVS